MVCVAKAWNCVARLFPMYGSGSGENNSPGNGYLSRDDFIEIIKEANN